MAKPVLQRVKAFDADRDHVFNVSWPTIPKGIKLDVFDAETAASVYSNKIETKVKQITIPHGSLQNGKRYYACVYVETTTNVLSERSDYIFFCCYSTPVAAFSNLPSGTLKQIKASSITCQLSYSQAQGRQMLSCVFKLYGQDYNGEASAIPIATSNVFYDGTTSYTFGGLNEKTTYKVQGIVETVDGMSALTPIYEISIRPHPTHYYLLDVQNDSLNGRIRYATYLIALEPNYPTKAVLHSDEGYVDCLKGPLTYSKDFNIDVDFSLCTRFDKYDLTKNNALIHLEGADGVLEIRPVKNADVTYSFGLYVTNAGKTYTLKTKGYDLMAYSYGAVCVRRVGNTYSMTLLGVPCYRTVPLLIDATDATDGSPLLSEKSEQILALLDKTEADASKTNEIAVLGYDGNDSIQVDGPITNYTSVTLSNARFFYWLITQDVSFSPTDESAYPVDWTVDTIMVTSFSDPTLTIDNYLGGNLNDVNYILIKRRKYGDQTWRTIYVQTVEHLGNLSINGYDYTAASEQKYEYAVVPIINNEEGAYCVAEPILSSFDGLFLIGANNEIYGTPVNATCDVTQTSPSNVVELLHSKYPKFCSNTQANYEQGNCSGAFVSQEEMCSGVIDTSESGGWPYRHNFMEFLGNKKPKIIKFETGGLWLANIINSPQDSAQDDSLPGSRQISFEFVEIGDGDSEKQMYEAGIWKYPDEWWEVEQ